MTAPRKMKAEVVEKKLLHKGFLKVFNVVIKRERHDGGTDEVTREILDRGHAVAVLAYDPLRDEVALVNEMRPGALWAGDYAYTDNLIAGGVAQGEDPVEAARRETREETGLELKDAFLVHPGAFVSSGGTSEKIAIVAGIVDTANAGGIYGCQNEKEDIKAAVMKADEFIRQVTSGEMNDLKTLVAGYWLIENRARLQLKYGAAAGKPASIKTPDAFRRG